MPSFRWDASLRTWCYALARNALHRLRRDPRRRARNNVSLSNGAADISAIVEQVRTATMPFLKTEIKDELRRLRSSTGIEWLQLSGDEPPGVVAALAPHAYKALRIGAAEDVEAAPRYTGGRILVDAKVQGALGGTGQSFDWQLVRELARSRKLVLAGGLRPDNVARAIAEVHPFGVDVASGVERAPGDKDPEAVRRFVEEARRSA